MDLNGKFNSAAAFVESGIQDANEDACSICLDNFTEDEPCTLTVCKHEYHLQCILEWAQRSQECPMCWQVLSLKDPNSQELLEACAEERMFLAQSVSPPTFLRLPFEDLHLHHRQYAASYPEEPDLDRRFMQHLAAAAAGMSRGRQVVSRSLIHGGHVHGEEYQHHGSGSPNDSPLASGSPVAAGTLFVGGNSTQDSPVNGNRSRGGLSTAFRSGMHSSNINQIRQGEGDGSAESILEIHAGAAGTTPRRMSQAPQSPNIASGSNRNGGSGEIHASLGDALKSRWMAASSMFRDKLRLKGGAVADIGAKAKEVGAGMVRAIERISEPGAASNDFRVPEAARKTNPTDSPPGSSSQTSESARSSKTCDGGDGERRTPVEAEGSNIVGPNENLREMVDTESMKDASFKSDQGLAGGATPVKG